MGETGGLVLSNSEMNSFRQCKRQWWLKYYLKWQPKVQAFNLRFGSDFHEVMELFYLGRGSEIPGRLDELFNWDPEYFKSKKHVEAMVFDYPEFVERSGCDDDLEVVSVEKVFQADLGSGGVSVRGKLDLECVDGEGVPVIVDHKSCANFDDIYTDDLKPQARTYLWLLRKYYGAVGRFVFNYARKVGHGKASKPPFYMRHEVFLDDDILDSHEVHMTILGEEMLDLKGKLDSGVPAGLVVSPSMSFACKWCDFKDVCPSFDSKDFDSDYILEKNFVLGDPDERYGVAT